MRTREYEMKWNRDNKHCSAFFYIYIYIYVCMYFFFKRINIFFNGEWTLNDKAAGPFVTTRRFRFLSFFFKLEISFLLSFFLSFFLLFFSFAPRSSSYRRRISTADEYFTAPALCVCVCVCVWVPLMSTKSRTRKTKVNGRRRR